LPFDQTTPYPKKGWSKPNGSDRLGANSRRLRALIAATALLAAALPGFAAQDNHAWKTYANERFGFSVCYPSDLLRPEAAPDNNDGRTFIGSNGAKIAAWGSWNAMGGTLADSARQDEKRLANGKVTYKVIQALIALGVGMVRFRSRL
jgi:hypothetical protein